MSKKTSSPSTATAPSDAAASSEAAAPPATSSEIVPAGETALAEQGSTLEHLRMDLPHLAGKLAKLRVPTQADLEDAVKALSPEENQAFMSFWERRTEPHDGMGEGTEQSFTSTLKRIKLYQGSGDDQGRPEDCREGGLYVQHGPTLAVLPDDAARLEMPGFLRAAVIGFYNGRTYWAPKDNKGQPQFPPGFSKDHRGPICSSLDRQVGGYYDKCETCPFRPSQGASGEDRTCRNETTLFLMLENYNVYRMDISSTTLPTCATPIRSQVENWRFMWECFFQFSTEKRTQGDRRWFVTKSALARSKAFPQGIPTSEGFRKLAQYFARMISTQWYYPTLSRIYADATSNRLKRANATASDDDARAALDAAKSAAEDQRNNI